MTESALPLAWVDELLNGTNIDISALGPDFEDKESASVLTDDPSPIHDFGRFIDHSFSKQLEELASSITQPHTAPLQLTNQTTRTPTRTSRTKQRVKLSKERQVVGVRTDAARRMEIAQLKLEVPKLEARIDYLMQRAVSRAGHLPSLEKSRLINDKLREMARHQRLWIARGMSAISQSLPQCSRPLLNYSIHLPLDTSSRVKMLCDLKGDVLRDGREILHERMRYLSSDFLPRYELSSHTTAEGDVCASVFATVPVEGASSVNDVLDALREVLTLDKVFTCQMTGTCCIADAVDSHSDLACNGIAHRRCVCLRTNGRVIESKGVLFSEYQASRSDRRRLAGVSAARDCSEQATIVIHSVEDDQRHPHVNSRLCLDLTSIISIRHDQRHSEMNRLDTNYTSGSTNSIVIVRASFVKLRRCGVLVSSSELREEMDYMLSKGPEALEVVLDLLALRQTSGPESFRNRAVFEFAHQFTPLQDAGTWPSGDCEVSTA